MGEWRNRGVGWKMVGILCRSVQHRSRRVFPLDAQQSRLYIFSCLLFCGRCAHFFFA